MQSSSIGTQSVEEDWTRVRSLLVKQQPASSTNASVLLSNFPRVHLESRPDHFSIGGSMETSPYGIVNGTRLQIMGATIDTASFEAPDFDEPPPGSDDDTPLYNKSTQAFLRSIMGRNPPVRVDLPSEKDAFTYAEWYFLIMATYMPILHKPSFMKRV